jgi:hypothetical protein
VERYSDLSGQSGVTAYEVLPDGIKVQFSGGPVYLYTYASAGQACIEAMKQAALAGRGLATYISRYVKARYAARLQ